MIIADFTALIGLFAIPWTVAGLIHPAAAGIRDTPRRKVLGLGVIALVTILAIAVVLSDPQPSEDAKASDALMAMTALWMLSCLVWPFSAMVLRVKERASAVTKGPEEKVEPTPIPQPVEDEKLDRLSAEQHQEPDLEERELFELPEPIEPPANDAPACRASAADNPFAHLHPESVAPRTISFMYENSQGDISDREVTIDQVGTSHFAGFCHREGDERTFRFDRILGLATLTDSGEKILPDYLRDLLRGYDEQELRRRKRTAAKTCNEILFTGFKKDRRAELEEIARAAGMVVRTRVSENLDLLCAGGNAGPSKIAEALERGLIVLNEQQFLQMLETGEVPA
ncbi:BRCA1 C Terminus (BRCT) domain-containing protein [Azotobacter beijerinckii]|uniref:BRCA1 C Terminus (BRCT) domain-containing protein n=1 Tax=Azotobacter beijerinckii TaxID=170623 RepID=A0A1H6QR73_9GAMM|nr:BRCT domain-containing protein [Azotobacter beijerinckii]SEI41735.1 BRCA1 C Terminus (BRCT) domain-containing protein [Azotobacter beijerinckii]